MVKVISTGHLDRDIQDFLSGWGSCDLSTWDDGYEDEKEPTEDDLRRLDKKGNTRQDRLPDSTTSKRLGSEEKKMPSISQKKYTLKNRPKVLQPEGLRRDSEATRLKRLRFFRK